MKDVQVVASLHAVESKLEQYKIEYESINHSINVFKTQIQELNKKPDVPEEFKSFRLATESFISDLNQKQVTNKSSIESIKIDVDSLKRALVIHEERIRITSELLPVLEKQTDEVKQEASKKIVDISTSFSGRFNEYAEKQKSQLESFRSEALSAPKSVLESNNRILEKLEVAMLDASNAILKTNNIELAMKLLERKLEHLVLQVKKNELSQQG
jgi:hypothetical protein